jgi:hypothetical protein
MVGSTDSMIKYCLHFVNIRLNNFPLDFFFIRRNFIFAPVIVQEKEIQVFTDFSDEACISTSSCLNKIAFEPV